MDDQNKNLLLATALSFLVILVWFLLFPPQEAPQTAPQEEPAATATAPAEATPGTATGAVPGTAATAPTQSVALDAPRVEIDTPRLEGAISLQGARIDDLLLKDYQETIDPASPDVTLLKPAGAEGAQYALFGWSSPDPAAPAEALPGPDTVWTQVSDGALSVENPLVLTWTNDAGLAFTRTMSIDENYLFTVTDKVENTGAAPVSLYNYGVVERKGLPKGLSNFYILHEGAIRMADGKLEETKYKALRELDPLASEGGPAMVTEVAANGWIGFTEHYWQTILIPASGQPFTAVEKYLPETDIYRTSVRLPVATLAPGATLETSNRLFAGAKEWETIRNYQNVEGIDRFVDSIDWGWFFFLTKPIFRVLHFLHGLIGNMGLAIIALTFTLKALVFPLAYKSYVSMAKMKELQPEMEKIKEKAGDDRQKLQMEMMALYKEKKVNPAAGCLPILIQIPIFFSLYKVIFVTLELRHAPFFGWLQDLSARDPSSIFNLFGLLPWAAPEPGTLLATIFIGALPILLGLSMWLQQKLNPAPADATQAAVFAWMPWIFMFMLGNFASGLVLYWITNNLITFTQQFIIMKSHGHSPDIFGNIRASFRRKPAADTGDKGAKK